MLEKRLKLLLCVHAEGTSWTTKVYQRISNNISLYMREIAVCNMAFRNSIIIIYFSKINNFYNKVSLYLFSARSVVFSCCLYVVFLAVTTH